MPLKCAPDALYRFTRVGALTLTLLLIGCRDPDMLPRIESNSLTTAEIGFDLSLAQYEGADDIVVNVNAFAASDGASRTGWVDLSPSDTLAVSVEDQDVEPTSEYPQLKPTRFEFDRTSLTLPATLRVQLIRDGEQRDATETFVTLHAVFETISPREGDILPRDGNAFFEWTLRDGDGNSVGGAEAVNGIWARQRLDSPALYPPSVLARFTASAPGPDGISRRGFLKSISLVPLELRFAGNDGPWNIDVAVSGLDNIVSLPATFTLDPALANERLDGLTRASATAYPRHVPITIH